MKRLAALIGLVIVASACGATAHEPAIVPASPAPWHPKPLRSFRSATVARKLARADDLHLGALPPGMTLKVTRSAALATALKEFSKPPLTSVSAFPAWSTAGYRMKNRAVWVVVIPNQRVRANLGPGQGASPVQTETMVVFVDGSTGAFVRSSTV